MPTAPEGTPAFSEGPTQIPGLQKQLIMEGPLSLAGAQPKISMNLAQMARVPSGTGQDLQAALGPTSGVIAHGTAQAEPEPLMTQHPSPLPGQGRPADGACADLPVQPG